LNHFSWTNFHYLQEITGLSQRKSILKDITVKFYKNEITSLVGHNGAGKSTLISLICGLDKSYSGSIEKTNRLDKISVCPQIDLFFEDLTVEENLRLMAVVSFYD
jgi:ABC-type multidrug transport system ATPase subunit